MTGVYGSCEMPTESRWTVLIDLGVRRPKGPHWCLARCTCGTEREVRLDNIKQGRSLSCGCLRKGRAGRRRQDYAARFWVKVDRRDEGECWPWLARLGSYGYGRFWDTDRRVSLQAHRVSYELLVGPIPGDLTLDHLCRNKACVNPAHLEPVTREENSRRQFMTLEEIEASR